MDKAYELGINFFDTADVYGQKRGEGGVTEPIIGNWLAKSEQRREKTILATKVHKEMAIDPSDITMTRGLNAVKIRRACENSLKRLKTDYIDLYQITISIGLRIGMKSGRRSRRWCSKAK